MPRSFTPRPFTRAQALQNARFLELLGQTGNVRLSAREAGVRYSTMQDRRAKHAAFAQDWDAAMASAHARFHLGGGRRGPEAERGGEGTELGSRLRGNDTPLDFARDERSGLRTRGGSFDVARDERKALRTKGGEAVVVRTRTGKLQLRLAQPGKLNKQAEQTFLLALSASANVQLAAAAAGASPAAFYRRRRKDQAFDREVRIALKMGYDRLECALVERACRPEELWGEEQAWRDHVGENPLPPTTHDQAVQLFLMHRRTCRLGWELRERPYRVGTNAEVRDALQGALARETRGRHYERTGEWRYEEEAPAPALPPLELVTGWSRAGTKAKYNPGLALFGGWRIGEMNDALRSGTSKGGRKK